ncbi:NUDIX hydrolase [Pseudodesulfovibrio senegalensis]|uniref:NUDIX domain-containing protein n=1 Tax=Pseudodesulfovibrio senegalensis TaxID=1721087 RepID=A0A6N6N119_9BACT|nr:NUDIX domain-containing protein [Pseudodesulfovibrio senegalensis]KAB1441059.1 NUDIX domain-containing protein [Pseudodesulfovibrio senegalensis]
MKQGKPTEKPETEASPLLEVMDRANRPIAAVSVEEAHRQLLPHRSIQVLVYNSENKLFLQKRSDKKNIYPGRWDVSVRGHVHVGESALEAATRELWEVLRLKVDRLQLIKELVACPDTGHEFVSVFMASRIAQCPTPNPKKVQDGYYYSNEELTCLIKEFRELLTPGLVTLWEAGLTNIL